jgi:quercetin dioxygenase-like cupin family protein
MRRIGIVLLFGLCSAGWLQGQDAHHKLVTRADLRWAATAIPNLEMAIVSGDPSANGQYVLRFRTTKLTRIPPHWHPVDEQLTVLTGTPSLGMGDHFVASALRTLHSGDFVLMPKESRHFAQFPAGTEVQLHGEGPFVTNWVDPKAIKALKPSDVDSNSERTKMKQEQDKR